MTDFKQAEGAANKSYNEVSGAYSSIGYGDLGEWYNHNRQARRVPDVERPDKKSQVIGMTEAQASGDTGVNKTDVVTPKNSEKTSSEANSKPADAKAKAQSGNVQTETPEAESKKDEKSKKAKNGQTGAESDKPKDKKDKKEKRQRQNNGSPQEGFNGRLVEPNGNGANSFSASGEFTEEQLVKMYRQMQADRARTQQLLSHVTSPYAMHGSVGESAAMAAGAFMGFALGRTMYKISRIGHLRQDWRLRREVLRQERGYYNQGSQGRVGGILNGFSNAAGSFAKGFRRGTRKDIDVDAKQQQSAEKVEVKAAEETPASEQTAEKAFG